MILGQSVTPSEGEVSIKSYQCSEYKSRFFGVRAKGYLEVTNKRILFQALGKGREVSVIHNEADISSVSGIKIYKGIHFNWIRLIFSIGITLLMLILFIVLMANADKHPPEAIIFFILLISTVSYILFRNVKKSVFSLVIQTNEGGGSVVKIVGSSPFGEHSLAAKALAPRPAEDSDLLFKEIGALVSDVQNMGEGAIEKWKKMSLASST